MSARPLRVLHLNTERGWRGGERQTLWLAEALMRAGHRSLIAARPAEPLAQRARERGIPVVPCAPRGELAPFAAVRLRRFIRREPIDVVHAHTGHAVALAALATLGTRAAVVATRRVDFRLHRNVGTRWKYGRVDGLIAISRAVAEALVQSGIPRERIQIVHSGVDLARQVAPAPEARLAALGARGRPLVVQVAALVPHKDPATFVRAMAVVRDRVRGVHALMLGEGPLRGIVEELRRELGLEDVVHMPGHITDADAVLAAADVATLSSREEGLGTALLDAAVFGTPVAATAAGGIGEIVLDGETGLLVPADDAAALGAAILRLLSDRMLAARLAAAARTRVETRFSVVATAARTVQVYRHVLQQTRH